MNQIKIGNFLRELRKEKGLTQEQLAEKFNVARRTVSRWETGNNMPDLDILIELSDYYEVDLRELLNGERTCEKMDKELKETVLEVAEYSNAEKQQSTKIVMIYFSLGIIALVTNAIINLTESGETFLIGFIKCSTFGLAFIAMIMGVIYISGRMSKLHAVKMRLLGKQEDKS